MHSHENPPRRPGAVKLLSAFVTLLVLGALILASRSISPWTQIAAAGDKATANAVVKANAFLETLDAKQRGSSTSTPKNRRGPTCR